MSETAPKSPSGAPAGGPGGELGGNLGNSSAKSGSSESKTPPVSSAAGPSCSNADVHTEEAGWTKAGRRHHRTPSGGTPATGKASAKPNAPSASSGAAHTLGKGAVSKPKVIWPDKRDPQGKERSEHTGKNKRNVRRSAKRERSSSSSKSSSAGAAKRGDHRTTPGKPATTTATPSSSPQPGKSERASSAMEAEFLAQAEEAEQQQGVDDDTISKLEQFSIDKPGQVCTDKDLVDTFASKTKGKGPRVEYPFLITIHPDGKTMTPLEYSDFNELRTAVQDIAIERAFTPEPLRLSSGWNAHLGGKGIIACNDKFTQDWFIEFLRNDFKTAGGKKLRVWKKGEGGNLRTATVPVQCNLNTYTNERIINALVHINDLKGACTIEGSSPWAKGGRGARIIRVHIDREFDESLRALKRLPSLGIESFRFYYRPFPAVQEEEKGDMDVSTT